MQIPPLPPVKVVISGPSGVGKDAVIKALQASRPDLHFVVTATSRHAGACYGLLCKPSCACEAGGERSVTATQAQAAGGD